MTTRLRMAASPPMRRVASRPSSFGICTSMSTGARRRQRWSRAATEQRRRPRADGDARASRPPWRPPAGRAHAAGRIRRPRDVPAGRTRRVTTSVVLADDQALVRAGFRLILEAEDDLEVVGEASDGEQAIAVTRRLQPDVGDHMSFRSILPSPWRASTRGSSSGSTRQGGCEASCCTRTARRSSPGRRGERGPRVRRARQALRSDNGA